MAVKPQKFGLYTAFDRDRPSALVVGHERSGNHFLMNTLARAYGYIAEPWFNLDQVPHPINYFQPAALLRLLLEAGNVASPMWARRTTTPTSLSR